MPYRGIGQYRLLESLKSCGPQHRYYLFNGTKRFFKILNCSPEGLLDLA